MELDKWTNGDCEAEFGTGKDFATLYRIETKLEARNKGLATALLTEAKRVYESEGKKFGSTIFLSAPMAHIGKKLNIEEYTS